ncbi:MAG: ABC transporter permease [Ardenticatenaceae bacterium]|nr:ABC transporter permease [Ardenticatenaceae bacterium]MCB9444935.1 ABC transporter permease [Ardenticatenaceae bacterium]
MSVIWDKVWFDLWQHKARTGLAVLSIAVGVFAIGVIFGMIDQLLSTMDASHQAVQPSHLNLVLRQFIDRDTAESLTDIPGVAGVEPLNIRSIRYKTGPDGSWESGTMVMRDDYENQKYDWLELKEGVWPSNSSIDVERITSDYYGIDIGDEIIIEMDGTDRAFPVTGKIRHPFVPPPDFGGSAYFFTDAEGMARLNIPQGLFVQLLVRVEPYSEEYVRDRAAAIKEQLAKQGIGISISVYQKPEEHWGRPFVSGITIVLKVLAIVSLFTSVIIVINTTTAIITQQTDQIGVIKAIGGTASVITKVYLAGVLAFGVLALLFSLPLGVVSAFFGSKYLLTIFNIDYDVFQFSSRAVIYQVLAAIAAPLLAALWPVLSGAAISVREAIATYGLGGDFGTGKLDQVVEKIGEKILPSPYSVALGNMFRRKGRLALTQLVLTLAGAMFLMVLTLASSMTYTLNNELDRRQYDMRLFFFIPHRSEVLERIAEDIPGVAAAEPWFSVTGTVLREGESVQDTGGLGAELYGVPVGSELYRPYIVNGRWLNPDETDNAAVISQETADFNNLDLGDTITIDLGEMGTSDWQIVGTYEAITPDPITTDPIYAPETAVVAATQKTNQATQLLVRAEKQDANSTAALMQALTDKFQERGINVNDFFSRTKSEDRAYAVNQFSIVTNIMFGLALVMGVVGGIGLMGSLSISVVERTREIGVLRSIGADNATIMWMFVMEGVLQGLLSWLMAVPLGFVVARPMSRILGQTILQVDLDFAFNGTAVLIWLIAILSISVLASLVPAHNAARISVRESLAYA